MKNEELFETYPELDYIRKWTQAIEHQNYKEALSMIAKGIKLAKKRRSLAFVKHFEELTEITKLHSAIASGDTKRTTLLKRQARIHCSFCGKKRAHVSSMIAGAGGYICDECVRLCSEILSVESQSKSS